MPLAHQVAVIRFPLVVFVALLVSVVPAHAQSTDLAGGAAVHFIDNCPQLIGGDTCVVLGGWSGAVAVRVASRLSLVGEIGRFGGSFDDPREADARAYGFMAGPRLGWRRDRVWRPFAQLLAGVVRATASSVDTVFVGTCLEFRQSAECQLV
jgi:hypothetical protein